MKTAIVIPAAESMAGAGEIQLRHGYTLDHLTRLAHWTARRKLHEQRTSLQARYEAAWYAIVEYLYDADAPPTPGELVHAGWLAIRRDGDARDRFLGYDRHAGTTWRGFERYWQDTAAPSPGFADAVTDRLALTQIWPRLRPCHRDAFTALAVCGDYQRAAESLGISYVTFKSRISDARREFLALWHDGEKPSRPWVRDRRAGPGTDQHTVTYFLRSRRLRERNAARVGTAEQQTTHHDSRATRLQSASGS